MSFFCYRIAYLFFWLLSFALLPFSKKLRLGILGRRGLLLRLKTAKAIWVSKGLSSEPYWFHFASSGELEQAIPIAEEIKIKDPSASILFTFFSPSGQKGVALEILRRQRAHKTLPWDAADYVPLDLPWQVGAALNIVTPKALILINREIWPELIFQSHQKQIPIYLFCAFFPLTKSRMLKVWRPYLKLLKQIGTVGDSSTQLLLSVLSPALLGTEVPPNVISVGDTRIERVLQRKELQSSTPAWGTFLTKRSLFVGASLWDEDFEALKPTIERIAKDFPSWRICLVPHEPNEALILKIKAYGKKKAILFRRFSHFLETPDEVSPLIMDQVGLLAELYRFSQLTFVGGSFKSKVHNVLEPAAYHNAIITGPFIQNSFEATEMNQLKQGLQSVKSPEEALQVLLNPLSNALFLKSQGIDAYQYLLKRRGAAKKYCELIS